MDYTKSQIIEAKIEEYLKAGNANINWNSATMKNILQASKKMAVKYGNLINETFDLETIADDLPELKAVLQNLRSRCGKTTAALVDIQNERAKINIKTQVADSKSESIDNLIERIRTGTVANDGAISEKDKFLVDDSVMKHIATEGCIDTLEDNAEIAADAGIKTTFIRHLGADGCCKWCQDIAGQYTYDSLPDMFWATHDNCDCWMEYKTERVHTKITFTNRNANGNKHKITEDM